MNIKDITWLKRTKLNEDVGFAGSDGFTFAVSNNSKDSSDENNKKGGRSKMDKSKRIFRLPTKAEIEAAFEGKDEEPSDYQLSALTAFSSIMNSFGFTYRVARSKKAALTHSTLIQAEKKSSIIRNIFALYDEEDPIEIFYDDLNNSKDVIERKFEGINIANILKRVRDWREVTTLDALMPRIAAEVRSNFGSDAGAIAKQTYNNIVNRAINSHLDPDDAHFATQDVDRSAEYEPSQKEIELTKKIYRELLPVFQDLQMQGIKPQTWVKRLDRADTFNAIMNEDLMSGFKPEMLSFNGTIGEYRDRILAYLKSVAKPGEKMHAKTVIDNEVQESLTELAEKMKRLGYKDGFNIENWFDYLKEYDDDGVLRTIAAKYDLTKSDLTTSKFPDFESFMRYFYEPERLYNIFERLNINFRARKAGEVRKGASSAVNVRSQRKKLETAEKAAQREKDKKGRISQATQDKIANLKRDAIETLAKVADRAQKTGNVDDSGEVKKFVNAIMSTGEDEYYTSTFIVKTMNKEIVKFIKKQLEKNLKEAEPYVNIFAYTPGDEEWHGRATEIAIDYPRDSKLYKVFKNKGYAFMVSIMKVLSNLVENELGKRIGFVHDRDDIHINIHGIEVVRREGDIDAIMDNMEFGEDYYDNDEDFDWDDGGDWGDLKPY